MNIETRPVRRALLAAGTVIGTAFGAALVAVPADAAVHAPPTVTLDGQGTLTITGDATDNGLIVGRTPAGVITLNGTDVLGGTATLSTVTSIHLVGGEGNDTLRLDETNGAMPKGNLDGGGGNDKLFGGSADDTLIGGNGNDRISGGPGADTVSMGEGSDQFTLETGDGSDHLDGDGGKDTALFNGFKTFGNFTQFVSVKADGSRTELRRAQPVSTSQQILDVLSVGGVELVKMNLNAGPAATRTNQFSYDGAAPDLGLLRVDIGAFVNPEPNLQSSVGILGTDGPDKIRIGGRPTEGVTVTQLGTTGVVLTGAFALLVDGQGGDDIIDAALLSAGTVRSYSANGGFRPGNDTLIGSAGNDTLTGGTGNSHIEGRAGNDHLIGGPGDDQIFGGDGDDLLEGHGGHDVLDGHPGNDVIIP